MQVTNGVQVIAESHVGTLGNEFARLEDVQLEHWAAVGSSVTRELQYLP